MGVRGVVRCLRLSLCDRPEDEIVGLGGVGGNSDELVDAEDGVIEDAGVGGSGLAVNCPEFE